MQWWFAQLNAWYLQQAGLVNQWYGQLSAQCTNEGGRGTRIPARRPTMDDPGGLKDDAIEDLRVDDEDKTVRIRIPSTPQGFR
jgi:hypothetical protein